MSTSLAERVATLERTIARQQELIERIIAVSKVEGFVPASKAAVALNLNVATIRERIKHAKAFPKESPYKEGIHWKQVNTTPNFGKEPSYRYLVNISEWSQVK